MSVTTPNMITQIFAADGEYVIPPVNGTNTDAAVSQQVGFPQTQSTPLSMGGEAVNREQTNGIFYLYSSILIWINTGGTFTFDTPTATTISGYNKDSILWCSLNKTFQISLQDSNTSNFNTNQSFINDGVNWQTLNPTAFSKEFTISGLHSFSVPVGVNKIYITMVGGGGGGGGGGSTAASGGGGSSGNTLFKQLFNVTSGETLVVNVGSGGVGGNGAASPAIAQNGGNGTSTQVNRTAGPGFTVVGGIGGAGAAGTPLTSGGEPNGIFSIRGGSSVNEIGGDGGSSSIQPGPKGAYATNPSQQADSGQRGAGGAGGAGLTNKGGNGGDGYVLLEWGIEVL